MICGISEGKIEEETEMGFRIHTFIYGNVEVCCERQEKNILSSIASLGKAETLK